MGRGKIERRPEYTRDLQAKRLLSNIGKCVPQGGDQAAVPAPQQPPAATFAGAGAKPTNVTLGKPGHDP